MRLPPRFLNDLAHVYGSLQAEMDRLYSDSESECNEVDLTGLQESEKVREMVRTVGAIAYDQSADFLELCGREIENHFTGLGIAKLSKKRTRAYVARNWFWEARYNVKGGEFWCSVWLTAPPEIHLSLPEGACGVLVPYVWCKGSHKAEEAVDKVLGTRETSRWRDRLLIDRGTTPLACIAVRANPPDGFDVDRDQLVSEVMTSVSRIGVPETRAIAAFVAGLKESEADGDSPRR